ncbi:multiple epidermal growth factor-like domains protein 10 [Dreissena polymorpha]|uniref:multiple epidermal growth factor-like domains protein 10 n=1 Tax=Dreissena polymorpha TaxID=45954 RepID=UPI0022656EDA|nr:multiple epidermal growth factor-like domains protein 10 [Dreissena polymorpha]
MSSTSFGTVGGPCQSGNCVSKNSECTGSGSTAICVCKAGFTLIDGSCVANGSFGGLCVGTACPLDKNAQCVDGRCVCTIFSSPFNGMCITIQANFGTCNTTCNDKNAACMSGHVHVQHDGQHGGSCIASK